MSYCSSGHTAPARQRRDPTNREQAPLLGELLYPTHMDTKEH